MNQSIHMCAYPNGGECGSRCYPRAFDALTYMLVSNYTRRWTRSRCLNRSDTGMKPAEEKPKEERVCPSCP